MDNLPSMNQPVERDRDKLLMPDLRRRMLPLRSDRDLLLTIIVSTTSHPEISKPEKHPLNKL